MKEETIYNYLTPIELDGAERSVIKRLYKYPFRDLVAGLTNDKPFMNLITELTDEPFKMIQELNELQVGLAGVVTQIEDAEKQIIQELVCCPCCRKPIYAQDSKPNYCSYCGQKLDWEGIDI